jgi:hypothetical protein
MPILAERAAEIASGKSRRKNSGTGAEVVQGLFFYRVFRKRRDKTV